MQCNAFATSICYKQCNIILQLFRTHRNLICIVLYCLIKQHLQWIKIFFIVYSTVSIHVIQWNVPKVTRFRFCRNLRHSQISNEPRLKIKQAPWVVHNGFVALKSQVFTVQSIWICFMHPWCFLLNSDWLKTKVTRCYWWLVRVCSLSHLWQPWRSQSQTSEESTLTSWSAYTPFGSSYWEVRKWWRWGNCWNRP